MSEKLDALLGVIDRELRNEIEHTLSIEAWAYDQQPFKVGDRAVIKTAPSIGPGSGWWSCREYLIQGSTGVIRDVHFFNGRWGVLFQPDVQWSISTFDGSRRTDDRASSFYFRPEWLRKRKKKDVPLTVPSDAKPWRAAS